VNKLNHQVIVIYCIKILFNNVVNLFKDQGRSSQLAINVVRFTNDGTYAMAAGDDRSVYLFNPHKADPSFPTQDGKLIERFFHISN
jgi:hypothetical protein